VRERLRVVDLNEYTVPSRFDGFFGPSPFAWKRQGFDRPWLSLPGRRLKPSLLLAVIQTSHRA
jgi:hypothetical protein